MYPDSQLGGIYVEIMSDSELGDDENYLGNLMGLLPAGNASDLSKAESVINAYAELLRKAGMDVVPVVRKEDEVSVGVIKRFKRFYYDDFSFRSETSLPPETQTNL